VSATFCNIKNNVRSTFQIDQTIAIVIGDLYLDLHNSFDFIGYEYKSSEKIARLEWRRGDGNWISKELPEKLILSFKGVTNFAAQRRDGAMPFTEDNCLANITFLPAGLEDNFAAICPGHRSDDEHLSFAFQSGAGVKVWAESVSHEI